MDFVQRFQAIQLHRDTSDELIKDLLIYSERTETSLRQENQRLHNELSDARLDIADATKSRRELQQQIQQLEKRIGAVSQDNQHLKSHNPYVIVLIDGDGILFKSLFVRQGLEGGKKAAYALRQAILGECGDHADEIEVVAKIILGISHDAGYAPFLDEILRDESTRRRITIIEGVPTVRELVATGVNILNLNETLFRPDKLLDKTPLLNSTLLAPLPAPLSAPINSPSPPSTSSPATSYARVIKNASPPPQITLPLQPKPVNGPVRPQSQANKQPAWNPGARGLDSPIQVSQAALDSIKKRKDSSKLCNNHYLRGPCAKGDSCCFEHKYKPSADEINAIAFLARLNPCTNGQDCDLDGCIYGHHVCFRRRHPQIEEVSDSDDVSDPSEDDIDDFTEADIVRRVTPASSSKAPPKPSSSSSSSSSASGPAAQQQSRAAAQIPTSSPHTTAGNPAAYAGYQCLYPVYFDASRSRAEGRRVSASLAVRSPLAAEIASACQRLRLAPVLEATKLHPKDWANPGRVRVLLKEGGGSDGAGGRAGPRGSGAAQVKNKHHLYVLVARHLRENPTTEKSPALWMRLPGAPLPDAAKPYPRPAVPKGWKIGELLPYYSPAMTGGGVSENFFKDMMKEMQGGGDMASIMAAAAGGSGGGGGGGGEEKKKKDKKGKGKG
ncbi:hypothetical protein QBC33DRAFT_579667 [Phialemonium atrogriseum]|uniref:C3H1-type domain-containing protein n=1 Tax=Phialemonium atrogriseum TaxID=1093897 RepID=A0AAJ0FKH1_9PEZI|nr:uncharacterized protein QBC33DRAFT_579667 [Phialemonium atrogriseum]KAK1765554.1 hypothetical protein QBC33DRAFT_579667 [Phialemonium atrogriseum]